MAGNCRENLKNIEENGRMARGRIKLLTFADILDIKRTFADQLRVLHKAVPVFVKVVCRDTQTEL